MAGNNAVLCPAIAEEQIIISSENVNSLLLSNYERSVGSTVEVKCISPTHLLSDGTSIRTLVCGNGGQWNTDIPQCVDKRLFDQNGGMDQTTTQAITTGEAAYSYEMLPYIVGLAVLGLFCLLLITVLSYTLCGRCRSNSETNSTIFEGSRSSKGTADTQTEFWVEMAGARNFQCHELAQSRDNMVDIVSYTHLHKDWSGY